MRKWEPRRIFFPKAIQLDRSQKPSLCSALVQMLKPVYLASNPCWSVTSCKTRVKLLNLS